MRGALSSDRSSTRSVSIFISEQVDKIRYSVSRVRDGALEIEKLKLKHCFLLTLGCGPRTFIQVGPEMVKLKVRISFKRLQFIFFHSYVSSIAPKMTF